MAELAALVATYGYSATFVGVIAEGETVLVLSGIAAQKGYLDPWPLMALGAAAAMLTDNACFLLGRALGPALLARFPRLAPAVARAHTLVERYPNLVVIGLRFLYGMRIAGPCVIGSSAMTWPRFFTLDLIAAAMWSVCWVSAGYLLGEAMQRLFDELGRNAIWLLLGIAASTAGASLIARARHRKRQRT